MGASTILPRIFVLLAIAIQGVLLDDPHAKYNGHTNVQNAQGNCDVSCFCGDDQNFQCPAPPPPPPPPPQPQGNDQGICLVSCYCHNDQESQCVHRLSPSANPPPPPPPPTGGSHAGAAATGAAAAAAAAAAASHNNQQRSEPPPQPQPPPPPPAPQQPPPTSNGLVEVKCNWCIRPNCNPGACKAAPNFNAMEDAKALERAITGAGTTESVLMDILMNRSEEQLEMIRHEYLAFGKDMDIDVRGDTSGKVKSLYKKLMMPRRDFFAEELKEAFDDDDDGYKTVISILTSLSPCAIRQVGVAFSKLKEHKKSLVGAAEDASRLKFEEFLVEIIKANRKQGEDVDEKLVSEDVEAIKKAAGRINPDKRVFIKIFTQRSFAHLRKVKELFNKKGYDKDFDTTIAEETGGGKLTLGLQALMANIEDQPGYFADQIDKAMGVFDTDNSKLERVLRGRCGIDLGDIVKAYNEKHKTTLVDKIKAKNVGDYEDSLVRIVTPQKVN